MTGFVFVEQPEEFGDAEALVVRIPRGIRSKRKLLAVLADKLEFPRYFGWNWDALYDCLTNAVALERLIVVVHSDLPFGARSELRRIYLTLLSDVADRSTGLRGSLGAVFATADEADVKEATSGPR